MYPELVTGTKPGGDRVWKNVALAILEDSSGNVLLVERKGTEFPAEYSGYWGLPGGKFWFAEDGKEAVLREVSEETGLRQREVAEPRFVGMALERLEIIRRQPTTPILKARWQLYYYLTEVLSQSSLLTAECRWFTEEEMRARENIIPSVLEVISMVKDLKCGKLDFFFMEDTVSKTSAGLELSQLRLQAFRKIPWSRR